MQEFIIHERDPAKSLIALGPECIPHLLPYLNDQRKTEAWWYGRSSAYNLSVSDVVVCVLRKIGGEKELPLLRRRKALYRQAWLHARAYKNAQADWTDDEKHLWYMPLFRGCRSGQTILIWAIRDIEARIGNKNSIARPSDGTDAATPGERDASPEGEEE